MLYCIVGIVLETDRFEIQVNYMTGVTRHSKKMKHNLN